MKISHGNTASSGCSANTAREAMAQEADAINEKYQSDLAKDMLVSVIREVSKDAQMKKTDVEE